MHETLGLESTLAGRSGVALGAFPKAEKFKILNNPVLGEEREINSLKSIDFALLSSEIFLLSSPAYLVNQLKKKLVEHAAVALYIRPQDEEVELVHRILAHRCFEYISKQREGQGSVVLFRFLKNAVVLSEAELSGLPLRYRIADALNDALSKVGFLKRFLKKLALSMRSIPQVFNITGKSADAH